MDGRERAELLSTTTSSVLGTTNHLPQQHSSPELQHRNLVSVFKIVGWVSFEVLLSNTHRHFISQWILIGVRFTVRPPPTPQVALFIPLIYADVHFQFDDASILLIFN